MAREDIYNEIKGALGGVPGFFEQMDDAQLEHLWSALRDGFLTETSFSLKDTALIALGASYAAGCEYWIEFHTQTARLVGASEDNLKDAKNIAEAVNEWSKFLYGIKYDMKKWKEEVTAGHEFVASKGW